MTLLSPLLLGEGQGVRLIALNAISPIDEKDEP